MGDERGDAIAISSFVESQPTVSTTLEISDSSTAHRYYHPSSTKWQNVHILPKIMSQVYQPSPSSLSLPWFNKLVLQALHPYNLSQFQHNLYLSASAISL